MRSERLAAAALCVAVAWPAAGAPSRSANVVVGDVTTGPTIRRDALGLGFEATALRERLLGPGRPVLARLLRNLGPGSIRIGGNSLDRGPPRPIGRALLAPLFALVRPIGWTVLLGLDLGHLDPARSGREAALAARLGGHALAAVEIGNEPDLMGVARPGVPAVRPRGYGVAGYLREWRLVARAVAARAPGAKLAGPDVFDTPLGGRMLRALVRSEHGRLALATAHLYPLSAATRPRAAPTHADIPHLLSPATRRREDVRLRALVRDARGVPLRIDELNSVVGFGRHGVSDTLAGALWTLDVVPRTLLAGAVGVNLETSLTRCGSYNPICAPSPAAARADRVRVQPNYLALLMLHQALRGRLLPVRARGDVHVSAFATAEGRRLRLLVVNLAGTPVAIRARVPGGTGLGTELVLSGPGLGATGGATLGGRSVAPDGRWTPGPLGAVAIRHGSLGLRLAPSSAALLLLPRPDQTPSDSATAQTRPALGASALATTTAR